MPSPPVPPVTITWRLAKSTSPSIWGHQVEQRSAKRCPRHPTPCVRSKPSERRDGLPHEMQAEHRQDRPEHDLEAMLAEPVERLLADPVAGRAGDDHRRHQRGKASGGEAEEAE